MSSPPPGGPQNPPSPPQYPQQYPAQQPYPQQYPPQQPYYAQPATPPPKKSNAALIIVVVIVVVLVVLVAVAWWAITSFLRPVNTATQITVTGVSWTINYPGTTDYFGTSPITTCTVCPIRTSVLQQFTYTLALTNSDSVAHNVTAVSLASFTFSLLSTSPDLSSSALSVPAGATRSVILTIQPSTFGGSYTLSGTISTT